MLVMAWEYIKNNAWVNIAVNSIKSISGKLKVHVIGSGLLTFQSRK